MSGFILDKPCKEEYKSKYCFPCVSGLCPYDMDFFKECYPGLDSEQKNLFEELFSLRAEIARNNPKEYGGYYLVTHRLTGESK
jgi:hypothetical protein